MPTKIREANSDSGAMARSPRRRSTARKHAASTNAAADAAWAGSVQPEGPDPTVSAQVAAPRPAVASSPPQPSSGRSRPSGSGGRQRQASSTAPPARGRLIRKITRQPTVSISQPPSTGPSAPIAAPVAAQMPIARPLPAPLNVAPRMARLFGRSMAAPAPCTALPASSTARLVAQEQASEAAANSTVPAISIRRRPWRSPAAPPSSSSALSGSR